MSAGRVDPLVLGEWALRSFDPVQSSSYNGLDAFRTASEEALAAPYESYWRDSADGLFAVRVLGPRQFVYVALNSALERSLGLTQAQVAGRQPSECLPRESAAVVTERYQACVQARRSIHYHEILDFPSGQKVCETTLTPFLGESGNIEVLLGSCRDAALLTLASDAEPRRGHGQSLPTLLLSVLDSIETHVAVLDLNGRIRLVNAAWRRFGAARGARPDAYVGESYLEVCERAAMAGDADAQLVRQGLVAIIEGERTNLRHHYSCSDQVFQLRATRIHQGGAAWILLTHADVTAVSQARDELSRLTEQLLNVQEEERRRIALELHDSTSQHLVALQLGLAAVRGGRATEEILDDMARELAEAHKEIRTLSYLLHPPTLAREGLKATLRGFVKGFGERTAVSIELTTKGAIDALPIAIQRSLFRVVQEAMSNAHRHGQSRRISVEIRRKRRGVELLVADDGRQPKTAGMMRHGVGIPGMDARIRRFQGVFSIDPTPSGTRVCAFIPASGVKAAEAKREE